MNESKIIETLYAKPKGYSGFAFAAGRAAVYDINGIAPSIVTMGGGGNKPYVPVKEKKNEQCS